MYPTALLAMNTIAQKSTMRPYFLNTWMMGADDCCAVCLISSNTGDSSTERRTM